MESGSINFGVIPRTIKGGKRSTKFFAFSGEWMLRYFVRDAILKKRGGIGSSVNLSSYLLKIVRIGGGGCDTQALIARERGRKDTHRRGVAIKL